MTQGPGRERKNVLTSSLCGQSEGRVEKRYSTSRKWSEEESSQLRTIVMLHGDVPKDRKFWSKVAEQLKGKSGKQCRERWQHHLRPNLNKQAWTLSEEYILARAHSIAGSKWTEVVKVLPDRAENTCKNHFNSTCRAKPQNRKTSFFFIYTQLSRVHGASDATFRMAVEKYTSQQGMTPLSAFAVPEHLFEILAPRSTHHVRAASEYAQHDRSADGEESGDDSMSSDLELEHYTAHPSSALRTSLRSAVATDDASASSAAMSTATAPAIAASTCSSPCHHTDSWDKMPLHLGCMPQVKCEPKHLCRAPSTPFSTDMFGLPFGVQEYDASSSLAVPIGDDALVNADGKAACDTQALDVLLGPGAMDLLVDSIPVLHDEDGWMDVLLRSLVVPASASGDDMQPSTLGSSGVTSHTSTTTSGEIQLPSVRLDRAHHSPQVANIILKACEQDAPQSTSSCVSSSSLQSLASIGTPRSGYTPSTLPHHTACPLTSPELNMLYLRQQYEMQLAYENACRSRISNSMSFQASSFARSAFEHPSVYPVSFPDRHQHFPHLFTPASGMSTSPGITNTTGRPGTHHLRPSSMHAYACPGTAASQSRTVTTYTSYGCGMSPVVSRSARACVLAPRLSPPADWGLKTRLSSLELAWMDFGADA